MLTTTKMLESQKNVELIRILCYPGKSQGEEIQISVKKIKALNCGISL